MVRQHIFPSEMETFLQLMMGSFWIITYLILIYKGFKEKSCGMPFAALCGNITWEFIYSFLMPSTNRQVYINYLWFGLDLIILYQFIKFSRQDLPSPLSDKLFIPTLFISLFTALSLHYLVAFEFSNFDGAYTAFGSNLMMSLLFILMLLRRNHLRGQSIYIALFKWVGTASASFLAFSLYPHSLLLWFFYVSTFFFDVLYIFMLYGRKKAVFK
jgi:hypothetical protein